jgi:hypothetical protein
LMAQPQATMASSTSHPILSSPVSAATTQSVLLLPEQDTLTIDYLQRELLIKESALSSILMRHSWLLYLKVETNLK